MLTTVLKDVKSTTNTQTTNNTFVGFILQQQMILLAIVLWIPEPINP